MTTDALFDPTQIRTVELALQVENIKAFIQSIEIERRQEIGRMKDQLKTLECRVTVLEAQIK